MRERESNELNADEATGLVRKYCSVFVESVVILVNHWFLVASFSSFKHNNPKGNDCVDRLVTVIKAILWRLFHENLTITKIALSWSSDLDRLN